MKIGVGLRAETSGDKMLIYQDDVLIDQLDEQDVDRLIKLLKTFKQRPRDKYYLWRGNNGTIISHLTKEADLPRIGIGACGKREHFTPISGAFIKDKFGNFKESK